MVQMAERNTDGILGVGRNGRRSRGPSPNGHGGGGGGVSSTGLGTVGGVGGNGGGTVTPETSSDDDNSIKRNGKSKTKQSEYEEKIRVGRDYQAVCPPLIPEQERKPEVLNDRALLVWSPTKEIPDSKLEEYISVAKEKYGYNGEQALGMLFWHKHDLERAVMDLANFTPFPDEWTVEDKVLFEQAFQFHGKSFHRIRQMLPDKSIASLVKYYYSWKKTRHRQSVMDRQEKAKASKEGSENGSDNGSNEESDNDEKDQVTAAANNTPSVFHDQSNNSKASGSGGGGGNPSATDQNKPHDLTDDNESSSISTPGNPPNTSASAMKRQQTPPTSSTTTDSSGGRSTPTHAGGSGGGSAAGGYCTNCGVAGHILHPSPHGKLCFSCHHHWRRTGNKRPTSGPWFGKRSRDNERHKRKPPRGMYINHDDIVTLASSPENEEKFISSIDREIVSLLTQVQINKKTISSLKKKNSEIMEDLRAPENNYRINARWTNDEVVLGVECVRRLGKDFQAIAETLGTKTEAHVRSFYLNNRRRYNLDQLAKQHEAEKEASSAAASSSSSSTIAGGGGSSLTESPNNTSGTKKDDGKKKDIVISSNDIESDNPTSRDSSVSKAALISDEKANDSSSSTRKDNVIMEIDLDAEQSDIPPSKKFALSVTNQEYPKSSTV